MEPQGAMYQISDARIAILENVLALWSELKISTAKSHFVSLSISNVYIYCCQHS